MRRAAAAAAACAGTAWAATDVPAPAELLALWSAGPLRCLGVAQGLHRTPWHLTYARCCNPWPAPNPCACPDPPAAPGRNCVDMTAEECAVLSELRDEVRWIPRGASAWDPVSRMCFVPPAPLPPRPAGEDPPTQEPSTWKWYVGRHERARTRGLGELFLSPCPPCLGLPCKPCDKTPAPPGESVAPSMIECNHGVPYNDPQHGEGCACDDGWEHDGAGSKCNKLRTAQYDDGSIIYGGDPRGSRPVPRTPPPGPTGARPVSFPLPSGPAKQQQQQQQQEEGGAAKGKGSGPGPATFARVLQDFTVAPFVLAAAACVGIGVLIYKRRERERKKQEEREEQEREAELWGAPGARRRDSDKCGEKGGEKKRKKKGKEEKEREGKKEKKAKKAAGKDKKAKKARKERDVEVGDPPLAT